MKTTAILEQTRIPITIDVGFGDALGNSDYRLDYGSLLDFPSASVRAYSPETVIAEKFQAIVVLGIINGRMKDYYDLWALPKAVDLNLDSLQASIKEDASASAGTGVKTIHRGTKNNTSAFMLKRHGTTLPKNTARLQIWYASLLR